MAEKMSTLVLKADLGCRKCYNKMRKTLCQLHCEIRSQVWDKKQNTVTISGPFDPETMSQKLKRKAGKVITGIEIKKPPPPADKPADKKPEGGKPAEKKPEGEKPADKKPEGEKPADKKPEGEKPAEKKPAAVAPAPAPAEKAAEMKMYEPMTVVAYPVAQPSAYGVYYEGYDQGAPSYNYHHGYGRPVYNYGGNRGYVHGADYFSEENPTCSIM